MLHNCCVERFEFALMRGIVLDDARTVNRLTTFIEVLKNLVPEVVARSTVAGELFEGFFDITDLFE